MLFALFFDPTFPTAVSLLIWLVRRSVLQKQELLVPFFCEVYVANLAGRLLLALLVNEPQVWAGDESSDRSSTVWVVASCSVAVAC